MARGLRKTCRAFTRTLVLCMLGACAVAAWVTPCRVQAQGTFPLTFEPSKDGASPLANVGGRYVRCLERRTSQVTAVPDSLSTRALFLHARLLDENVFMAVEPSNPPVLYVDTDLDGDLSEEKALAGSKLQRGWSRFAWCEVRDPKREEAAPVRIALEARFGNTGVLSASIRPGGAWSGRITLGETTCTFAVADADFDGRYDGAFSIPDGKGRTDSYDFMWVDANGDGEFHGDRGEIGPLMRLVRIGDVYYSIAVKADGTAVTVEKTAPRFGRLRVSSGQVQARVYSGAGIFEVKGGDDAQRLPVGRYEVGRVTLYGTDEAGDTWMLSGRAFPQGPERFDIVEGETTTFELGPPLTLSTAVKQRDGTVSIGLTLTGKAGETYTTAVVKNGKRVDAPGFKILDERGKVLASGAFSYG